MPPRHRTASPRPSRFVGLPTELLTMIASYLTLVELAQVLVIDRNWHALLTTTPFLWQLVHIDFKEYPDFPLVRFLGYSKGLPLSLRLRNISPRQVEDVMPAVGANLYRMRILKLWYDECFNDETDGYGRDHAARRDYRERLFSSLQAPAPMLVYFAIGSTGIIGDRLRISVFDEHAPLLTYISNDDDFVLFLPHDSYRNMVSSTEYSNKTVREMVGRYPNLKVLRLCGEWSGFYDDAAFWSGVPSVGWAVSNADNDYCDDIVSYLRDAKEHGVLEFIVRSTSKQARLLRGFLREAEAVHSLCIAMGGHDFGIQRTWFMGVGLYVQISTPQGLSLAVGDCRAIEYDKDIDPHEYYDWVARKLMRCFKPKHFADIATLTICESVGHYMKDYLVTLELPQLTTLVIWIVSSWNSQRTSPTLFDCVSHEDGEEDVELLCPVFQVPKLRTLYLGSHPEFPIGAGGYFIREWQEDFIIAHVREATAVSVAEFIRDNLTFNSFRLAEILLAREVVFTEGFHSEETDRLRELTDDLRYLRVGESVAGVE
ncbi:hypothetical protein EXIGLDRAFT_722044 [Exidia glandulosa HHB12029]|uniref:F-box domain-containing protein n=1 Tax=Exidia glandulosa HHB12029 TaxID=1314781 RepID=A0A165FH71_EXIGL|nr:hypothetical protein EXIGLDRAFT_722044 [Exidia glandulosa HHB12029]